MKKNLALIGMSGTLKSTVGRRLAKKLQLLFIDTDDMIEFETGRSIPEIFELAGEDYFRSLERKLVASLSDYDGAVISTGGGIGADDENMRALSEHCTVIWLDATPRTIFYRLKNTKRTRPKLEPFSLKKVEELCLVAQSGLRKTRRCKNRHGFLQCLSGGAKNNGFSRLRRQVAK